MKTVIFLSTMLLVNSTSLESYVKHDTLFLSDENSIESQILTLAPRLNPKLVNQISVSVKNASKKYNLEHKYLLAIMMTESSFNQNAVSNTGDMSIAQINYKTWSKESERLKFTKLDKQKLKTDSDYSIHYLAQILNYLKTTYSHKDKNWYAIYHSKTCRKDFCPKKIYASKINAQLEKMDTRSIALAAQ